MEKSKKDQLAEQSMMMRGEILNDCIVLERSLDYFIARHFTSDVDKQVEILELLLERITFENKRTTLEAILRKGITPKDFKKKYVKLLDDLRAVIQERNYFAHYTLNVFSQDYEDRFPNEVGFVNFRNSTLIEWYDNTRYYKLRTRVKTCIKEIEEML